MKLWGGRFKKEKDKFMEKFDSSFPIDKRMWQEDIKASIAHVTMLGSCNIIDADESEKIISALNELIEDIKSQKISLDGEFEDIHSFVEYHIVQKLGNIGKKMHTSRSRNEQVAVDTKLYVKKSVSDIIGLIENLQATLKKVADKNVVSMPGYTHMQRAQIITFKYYLMAYYDMFERDKKRLSNAIDIMDTCPLGSGALAGSTYDIDRTIASDMLGFSNFQTNTLDTVSDRDYIIEIISDFSIIMMHISRMAEEFIIYSTKEFDFISISDEYSTGSSLMPQKKNPDSMELLRGKTGRIYANLMGILTVMKALPLAYNKDMQEDKSYYFESVDTVSDCIQILTRVVDTMSIKEENMKNATKTGFLNATELADYLVRKNIAFRDAHEIVGNIVSYCEEKNCEIHQLDIKELKKFCDLIQEDVYQIINPDTILLQGNKKYML